MSLAKILGITEEEFERLICGQIEDEEKMRDCEKCKYCQEDWIYDDELGEEYRVLICDKGHDTELDFECEDFKEYKPRKYKEKDTKCDMCKHLGDCINNGNVIDSRTMGDTRIHYVEGLGAICKRG